MQIVLGLLWIVALAVYVAVNVLIRRQMTGIIKIREAARMVFYVQLVAAAVFFTIALYVIIAYNDDSLFVGENLSNNLF